MRRKYLGLESVPWLRYVNKDLATDLIHQWNLREVIGDEFIRGYLEALDSALSCIPLHVATREIILTREELRNLSKDYLECEDLSE